MARLKISFRGAETVVSLARGETTVGRDNTCTIHLPDPDLAGVHFRIRHRTKGYQIKDDGSGIGTRVNSKPVYAKTLMHGDLIEAGGLRCRFLTEADAPERPAPAAEPEPPPDRLARVARSPRVAEPSKSSSLFIAVGAGAVALLFAFILLRQHNAKQEASRLWTEANELLTASRLDTPSAETHIEGAVELLKEIRDKYGKTPVASIVPSTLADARRTLNALQQITREGRAAADGVDERTAEGIFDRLARLKVGAHPAVLQRAAAVQEAVTQARTTHQEKLFAKVGAEVDTLVAEKKFSEALRLLREFEAPDYVYRKRADDARLAIEQRVTKDYRGLLRLAARGAQLDDRIALLEASRSVFKGTRQASDLEVRISALRARRQMRTVVLLKEKTPKRTPDQKPPTDGEKPPPEETGPYADPGGVAALVKARDYAKAAAALNAASRHPLAKVRAEELSLLANLKADLVAAIAKQPETFTGVLLPVRGGRGDAVGADARYLKIRKEGKSTQFAWEDMPAKAFPKLFKQAGFDKPPRLATALFLDEEGLANEARRAYVWFFKSEQAPTTLTRILARRRGIEPPAAGFVLFRNDLVTLSRKESVLLLERIEKLSQQARTTTNDTRRRAIWTELESIGPPAVEALTAVIKQRQADVVTALKKSKAFTPQRFAARFGSQLVERRKAALAFILDGKKYAYPNKKKEEQEEAERLVNLVREIYDKPYPLLLANSDSAKVLDAELAELDDRLAKLDPLAEPIHESVVEEVTKKLDTRLIAVDGQDQKRIAYNLAVEKYNLELKTSADAEERANVRAVNLYRHMMGLVAVKIDERLLRAARKHSIEMKQLEYFAHDSPTPSLKSPGHRAKREGYPGGVSENIARGASTGVGAFWQWFKSSGHHRNMLVPGHRELGCGAFAHHWWTQKFGRATANSLNPPKVPADPDPPGESGNGRPAPK